MCNDRLAVLSFLVVTATATAGCGIHPDDAVVTRESALSAGDARVLGFEAPADWSTSTAGAVLSQSTTHSQGSFSLKMKPSSSNGYTPIVSKPLSTLGDVGPVLAWDVMLPSQQPNRNWFGTAQTYLNCPSRGINSAFLSQIELTGKPLNVWNTLSFPVSNAQVTALLNAGYSDLTITVVLNVPIPTTGTYLVDNLRFLPAAAADCGGRPNGTLCDDKNACTRGDHCQAGTCQSSPVTCAATDQCHLDGVCNAATGTCTNPAKADGTACNDGSACTQADVCLAGACTGTNPVVCVATDQCHQSGLCDPATGACTNPAKPDGTACSDDSPCTQGDVCQAGACARGTAVSCPADQPITWNDAPVILTARKDYPGGLDTPGEKTPPEPVTFTIPDYVYVRTGNAGNGAAELKFRVLPSRTVVTCGYHGGARQAHPTTDLELMRGHRYAITSCDNGYHALQKVVADWFSLRVLAGDADDPTHETSVSVHAGGGCSDSLPAPLSAEEVVAMRDGFSWPTVAKLPETDVDGHPALFHGMIYIENKDQLAALDRLRVFWSAMPMSERYMSGLRGKCGRVEHATDGRGVVVYAVFPARFYNVMRDFAIQAVRGNVAPPFKFIIPTPPEQAEFVNADGSLAYVGLGRSRYLQWLQTHPGQQANWFTGAVDAIGDAASDAWDYAKDHLIDDAVNVGEYGFDYLTKGFDFSVDFLADFTGNVWDAIQDGLQQFVLVFEDKVTLKFKVSIMNRDPNFPKHFQDGSPRTHVTRAWGPDHGSEVFISGANLRVRQWGWGFLPVMDQSEIGQDGTVTLEAVKGASGRGGDLCVELDTDYAMITSDLIPNEVCDFAEGKYGDYQADVVSDSGGPVPLEINERDLFVLAQIKDSSDYERTVMTSDPYRFTVLTGWLANFMTKTISTQHRAMTLCLDFPGTGASAITIAGNTLQAAGALAEPTLAAITTTLGLAGGPLLEKDLWWPDADDAGATRDSRGVMTHEYGHFTMCSLLFKQDGPPGLTGLIARIFEGQDDSKDDEVAQMTEAWADTFSLQVVGAANYIQSPNSTDGEMHFCTATPCMDANYTGDEEAGGPFKNELARFESLFFDAFDRSDSSLRFTLFPGNADVWEQILTNDPRNPGGTQLIPSAFPYITNQDEFISLSGLAWRNWTQHWLARGKTPTHSHVVGGLVDSIKAHGYDWCDICDMLALHDKNTPEAARPFTSDVSFPAPTFTQRFDRWRVCQNSDEINDWLGPPPNEFLNLDARCVPCPLHQFVDATGACQPCPAGSVARGNTCSSCAPGNPSETADVCVVP